MRNNIDTETKTILHYAKKIKEYCASQRTCEECKLHEDDNFCYFFNSPYLWQEVDLHE